MSTYDKSVTDLKYFNPDEIGQLGLRPDAKVRIVDGIFEGKEGYYQRIKGEPQQAFCGQDRQLPRLCGSSHGM